MERFNDGHVDWHVPRYLVFGFEEVDFEVTAFCIDKGEEVAVAMVGCRRDRPTRVGAGVAADFVVGCVGVVGRFCEFGVPAW